MILSDPFQFCNIYIGKLAQIVVFKTEYVQIVNLSQFFIWDFFTSLQDLIDWGFEEQEKVLISKFS